MSDNNFYNDYLASDNMYATDNNAYETWEDEDYVPPVGSGLAITGMVLGIVALICVTLLFCCVGIWGSFVALPLSVAGLIVSIIALKKGQDRGMSIAGIVCCVVALLLSSIFMLLSIVAIIDVLSETQDTFDYYTF